MEVRVAPAPRWAEQSRGRGEPGRAVLLDTPRRGRQPRTDATLGLSVLFLSSSPSPTREMKLLGWATEAAETQLLRRSGVPCLGRPSHPGTRNGAWRAIDQSSPECKHLR